MNAIIRVFEIIVMISSTIFAVTFGFMMLRLKYSNKFDIRDYVESNLSFDLDLNVFGKIRKCYADFYKNKIIPLINLISFILMLVCFVVYFTLMVANAI